MRSKNKPYNYAKPQINFKDILEVIKALRSSLSIQERKVYEFEFEVRAAAHSEHCLVVSNRSAALHLCLSALGISSGDEVITSPNTSLASANCILHTGATPKFADIDGKTGCIDPNEIEKHVTEKTKCIIPVHYAGIPCDMKKIHRIARKHNLFVVEDAAHALGSEYNGDKTGCCKYSDAAIFSFDLKKAVTAGEGGAITTSNEELALKLTELRSHGIDKKYFKQIMSGEDWYYEMKSLGFNYCITGLQGALGYSQLKRLNKFLKKRRQIFEWYQEEFAGSEVFSLLDEPPYSYACFYLCPLLINFDKLKITKKELFDELRKRGMYLQVHYIPVHTQPYYRKFGYDWGDFPVAEDYYRKSLSLPMYVDLTRKDVGQIAETIKNIVY